MAANTQVFPFLSRKAAAIFGQCAQCASQSKPVDLLREIKENACHNLGFKTNCHCVLAVLSAHAGASLEIEKHPAAPERGFPDVCFGKQLH